MHMHADSEKCDFIVMASGLKDVSVSPLLREAFAGIRGGSLSIELGAGSVYLNSEIQAVKIPK